MSRNNCYSVVEKVSLLVLQQCGSRKINGTVVLVSTAIIKTLVLFTYFIRR